MIPNVNYFSGGLGKLKNIGGSKFFTTPHTVQVPVEYEISSGSQGEFIACTLDGRLWLFNDKVVALKWNSGTLRMELAASMQISNVKFIIRGIDWILTTGSFFQVLDDAPYIFSEQVSFDNNFSVDKFYSFLPPINGWQIVNNFLVRRYGNDDEASLHSLSIPTGLYLTHLEQGIYGKDSSYIGSVSIEDYQLVISQDYLTGANVSGLAFLDKTLYGFRLKQDSSLCPVSADTLLFNAQSGSWSNVFDGQDTSGNIFFDPVNCKALAVRDDAVNLLPEKKIFTAKGISQWVAPTRKIDSVADSFVIAPLEHDILATHLNSGLYREILHQKDLALTCRDYSNYKLSVAENNNILTFNKIVYKIKKTLPNIRFINAFQHSCVTSLCFYDYDKEISQVPVFKSGDFVYEGIDYEGNFVKASRAKSIITNSLNIWEYLDEEGARHFNVYSSVTIKVFYVDPVTGIPSDDITATFFPNNYIEKYIEDNEEYIFIRYAEYPLGIKMLDGKLVWEILKCTYDSSSYSRYNGVYDYIPVPEFTNIEAVNWVSCTRLIDEENGYAHLVKYLPINPILSYITSPKGNNPYNIIFYSPREAIFKENINNTEIALSLSDDIFNVMKNDAATSQSFYDVYYYNYVNINNSKEVLSIALFEIPSLNTDSYYYYFLIFKSEL